jgi:hypothetical protein
MKSCTCACELAKDIAMSMDMGTDFDCNTTGVLVEILGGTKDTTCCIPEKAASDLINGLGFFGHAICVESWPYIGRTIHSAILHHSANSMILSHVNFKKSFVKPSLTTKTICIVILFAEERLLSLMHN